jgi:hypothetical protein
MLRKFLPAIGILMAFGVVSCKKNDTGKDQVDCIDRYIPKTTDSIVSKSDMDSITLLFALNNLSTQNLEFLQWTSDSVNSPGQTNEQTISIQYENGLPVFQSNKVYFFKNGIYESYSNHPELSGYEGYTGPAPDPDSSGHIPIRDLRLYLLSKVSESVYRNNGTDQYIIVPDPNDYNFACLQVILGYLDASQIPGNGSSKNASLIKVWRITPTSSKNNIYPIVYVTDDRSVVWGETPLGPNIVRLFPTYY